MRTLRWTIPAILLFTAPTSANAAVLTVTVANIRDAAGHVRVGVCDRKQFLTEHCDYHAIVTSQPGSVSVSISGIQPGLYAVAAYQDATDAGHLRRGLFGIPKDGIGFSRDPPLRLGPPGFNRCAFRINDGNVAVTVALHYP